MKKLFLLFWSAQTDKSKSRSIKFLVLKLKKYFDLGLIKIFFYSKIVFFSRNNIIKTINTLPLSDLTSCNVLNSIGVTDAWSVLFHFWDKKYHSTFAVVLNISLLPIHKSVFTPSWSLYLKLLVALFKINNLLFFNINVPIR